MDADRASADGFRASETFRHSAEHLDLAWYRDGPQSCEPALRQLAGVGEVSHELAQKPEWLLRGMTPYVVCRDRCAGRACPRDP
jgi:hypothetical protein